MATNKKPTALIILDGFGYSKKHEGNAVLSAKLDNYMKFYNEYPHTTLEASGEYVGLPDGQMGNSEVGHQNIGAGRMVPQVLMRINRDIENGTFLNNPKFLEVIRHCRENGSALHIMGLCSHGGVHSNIDHLYALLTLIKKSGLEKVYVHCFTDGRDVSATDAQTTLPELENKMREIGCGKIATVSGRYYAMDRDSIFSRLQLAYDAMVNGKGEVFDSAEDIIKASYEKNITDEFIVPAIVKGTPSIHDNDGILFINFRPDRAKEIMRLFIFDDNELQNWYDKANRNKRAEFLKDNPGGVYQDAVPFKRDRKLTNLFITAMAQYDNDIDQRMHIAYDKEAVEMSIGEYLSKLGYTQLRIAETEKEAHVTSFFSGNIETLFPGEDRKILASSGAGTYDKNPEMNAYGIANECVKRIESGKYDFIVLNFANPDMVGHTGNFEATVKALEAVDKALGQVMDALLRAGGKACITADHGNADEMLDEKGRICKTHSLNPVPFILVDPERKSVKLKSGGALYSIAPTLLDIMGLDAPAQFTGETLIIHD